MGDAESVPEHYICVFDIIVGSGFDPGGEALGRIAGCLRYVPACGVDLVVGV